MHAGLAPVAHQGQLVGQVQVHGVLVVVLAVVDVPLLLKIFNRENPLKKYPGKSLIPRPLEKKVKRPKYNCRFSR